MTPLDFAKNFPYVESEDLMILIDKVRMSWLEQASID